MQEENTRKSRTQMRTKVFEQVYQLLLNPECDADLQSEFEKELYDGIKNKLAQLQQIVADVAIGFQENRLYKVDLSILILATYELYYCLDTPYQVIIDQAVELAKTYSTPNSSKFVNGILANILCQTRRQTDDK